jgi:hypothetical protein
LGIQVEAVPPGRERSSTKIEHSADFIQLRAEYPLQARLFLAWFSFADDAIEAMIVRHDLLAAQASVSKMAELSTWLTNTSAPKIDKRLSELLGTLVRADVPMDQVARILQGSTKKGKGAPVSNRLPVLLAYEQKKLNPQISWMKLAMRFCQCTEPRHDAKCRERIRHQAMELEEMITRLGV